MSYLTVEVEIDHGRVVARGPEGLPEKGNGRLTISETVSTPGAAAKPLRQRVELPLIRGDGQRQLHRPVQLRKFSRAGSDFVASGTRGTAGGDFQGRRGSAALSVQAARLTATGTNNNSNDAQTGQFFRKYPLQRLTISKRNDSKSTPAPS